MTQETKNSLEFTGRLRKELQQEVERLQVAIETASQTIAQARLAIVQLSISEDRLYAQATDTGPMPGPSAGMVAGTVPRSPSPHAI